MEVNLTNNEVDLLRSMVEKDIRELLLEIAKADHREFREELRAKENILESIREKLTLIGVS
ncbi:MAG: hypothetical protein GX536_06145 [Actinobacteria bacterium]|nr:hypothetical protein [Actinomycetota bacterium]